MSVKIAIESNLLVLLVVGSTSIPYIRAHKRCKQFTESDYAQLMTMIGSNEIILTANTVSETSNLLKDINDPARSKIFTTFREFIYSQRELRIRSRDAASRSEFIRLGVTDCALLQIAAEGVELLTTDVGLYLAAQKQGFTAYNFTHYQEAAR